MSLRSVKNLSFIVLATIVVAAQASPQARTTCEPMSQTYLSGDDGYYGCRVNVEARDGDGEADHALAQCNSAQMTSGPSLATCEDICYYHFNFSSINCKGALLTDGCYESGTAYSGGDDPDGCQWAYGTCYCWGAPY